MDSSWVTLVSTLLWASCAGQLLSLLDANSGNATQACQEIGSQISGQSDVVHALDLVEYGEAVEHFYPSSSDVPTCVLNAGSAEDVATAIKIIGKHRAAFAFKSGGHATNPGFSSTKGVHIYPGKINHVQISADGRTVDVGTGQDWATVYKKLDGSGLGVTGGRVAGPGVGGFSVGGGFSWKTNQYGLTVDTIKSYTVVLPNGTITKADQSTPDLFFALKGGMNRFGLVTSVELLSHPQGKVWGGVAFYDPVATTKLAELTARFDAENNDPKTLLITSLTSSPSPLNATSNIIYFHDGPVKPDLLNMFDGLPGLLNLDFAKSQSFSDFVSSVPSTLVPNSRGAFGTLSVTKVTSTFAAKVYAEANKAGEEILLHLGGTLPLLPPLYEIDPFMRTYGQYSTDSAIPHEDSPIPIGLLYSWLLPTEDTFWRRYLKESQTRLEEAAKAEGIYLPFKYANYALADTPAEELFGADNAARLRRIRKKIDPDSVMELAGGFAI